MRKERTIKAIKRMQKYCRDRHYCFPNKCPYNNFCDKVESACDNRLPFELCASYELYFEQLSK